MAVYDVCLEVGPAGECMAHVSALPGCINRAESWIEAYRALPDAIREDRAWSRRHGHLAHIRDVLLTHDRAAAPPAAP